MLSLILSIWVPFIGVIACILAIVLAFFFLKWWHKKETEEIEERKANEQLQFLRSQRSLKLSEDVKPARLYQEPSASKPRPVPVDWDKLAKDKKRGGYVSSNPRISWEDDVPLHYGIHHSTPSSDGDTSSTDHSFGGGDFGGGGAGSSYGDSDSSSGDSGGGDGGGGGGD
jgi:hypothetical protein